MIVKFLFSDREPYFTKTVDYFPGSNDDCDYSVYLGTELIGTIIGYEVEGLSGQSIKPIVKTSGLTIDMQIKGRSVMEIVGHEMILIEDTPAKELPLLLHDIRSWTGKKLFEEKIKCGT
jgi:hypothetical protein